MKIANLRYKVIISMLILLTLGEACKKSLLNSIPLDRYTDVSVWQDINLANLYVNNIYAYLTTEYDRVNTLMQASTTDEAKINRPGFSADIVAKGQYTASSSPYNSFWTNNYKAIRLCNVFFKNIASVPGDSAIKNRLTGEVKFLRAFFYNELFIYFGRFPIITEPLNISENQYAARNTTNECINYIVSELDSAASLLPIQYDSKDKGRATKGACYALKCRVLLFAGNWAEASAEAVKVMNLNLYSLFPDYAGIFYPQNDNNSEVIFDRQYISDFRTGPTTRLDRFNAPPNFTGTASGINDPTQNLVDLYQMKDGSTFDWSNPSHKARPYYNRDPRLDASIIHDSSIWQSQIIDMRKGSIYNPNNRPSATGYYMKKFLDPNFQYSNANLLSGQNFIYIRYAEILLNFAEAQFRLGNIEVARQYVNLIRARPSVNMPPISSADFNWDKYTHERQIELAFEGTRLWDIRRWQIGPQAIGTTIFGINISISAGIKTYTKTAIENRVFLSPKMYLFPIPQSEIDKYPNSLLEQNFDW